MKALREGRVPTPGSPGEEEEHENIPSISEFPSPPSNFTAPLPPNNSIDVPHTPPQLPKPAVSQPAVVSQPIIVPPPAVVPQISTPINTVDDAKIASAQKNAKWAISALDYEDIKTARIQLLSALNDIGFNQENNFGF